MKKRILNTIYDRLREKPFLELVETSVCKVPEHLQFLDPNIFVVFNRKAHRYEIHSLANRGLTFLFAVPWKELDERTIELFQKSNLKYRSLKEIVREIDEHNYQMEKRQAARRRDDIKAWASENRSRFKKFAEEVY
jgi:hypothetical protein